MKSETVVHDGVNDTYPLTQLPANTLPFENNVIVESSGKVLRPSDTIYFDVQGLSRTYTVNTADYALNSIDTSNVAVYLNGKQLTVSVQYNWTSTLNQLRLKRNVAVTGDKIALVIFRDGEYIIEPSSNNLQIKLLGTFEPDSRITVTTLTNHDILEIERSNNFIKSASTINRGAPDYYYANEITSGRFRLRSKIESASYAWVTFNGTLLTPELDYILEDNKEYIQLDKNRRLLPTDNVEIIVFKDRSANRPFAYRIFKDMLNRTFYKRIDDEVTTKLAQPLNYTDTAIFVEDAAGLAEPSRDRNESGIIYINAERIEYLEKDGNTLRYIRRGTLGTGTPLIHATGSIVRDQGPSQTIPYKDEVETVVLVADGFLSASTQFTNTPGVSVTSVNYANPVNNGTAFPLGGQTVTVRGTGFKSNVEVFVGDTLCPTTFISSTELTFVNPAKTVGAYDLVVNNPAVIINGNIIPASSVVAPGAIKYLQILLPYAPIVRTSNVQNPAEVGNWYRSSIPEEYWQALDIEVFVGGRRLRKTPISIWTESVGPDSPSGDVQFEAEYAVNRNEGQYVRLTEAPPKGSKIVIQKKLGQSWTQNGVQLVDSTSDQAKFIRAKLAYMPGRG